MKETVHAVAQLAASAAPAALSLLLLSLLGCNHVYFYQTSKVGLVLEARPDPTAPLTGSFGGRQRVVALVPSTDSEANTSFTTEAELREAGERLRRAAAATDASRGSPNASDGQRQAMQREAMTQAGKALQQLAGGDAMSVLSSFRFRKFPRSPGTGGVVGRVRIDASLITGHAAIVVATGNNMTQAVEALSGAEAPMSSTSRRAALRNVVAVLRELRERGDGTAAGLLRDLDRLEAETPERYGVTLYEWDNADSVLRATEPPEKEVPETGIDKALNYGDRLALTSQILRQAVRELAAGNAITLDLSLASEAAPDAAPDAPADAKVLRVDPATPSGRLVLRALELELEQISERSTAWNRRVGSSGAYRSAVRHAMGLGGPTQ